MPKAKPGNGKSRGARRQTPYQVQSPGNRVRRLLQRMSTRKKPARERIRQLMSENEGKMTDEVRKTMNSLLSMPIAEREIMTDLDLLVLYNYPLNYRVKQIQYNTLAWLMGSYRRTPGAGSLADVSLTAQGVVTGRPGFSVYTQQYMKAIEDKTGHNPTNARRHVVAWHTIRSLMNLLISSIDGQPAAAQTDSEEEEKNDDAELSADQRVQRVAQMLSAIDASKVPDAVKSEADDLLKKMPDRPFGGHGDAGKTILRSLFIMFGNPLNLWWGNSRANSRLPGIYTRTMNKLKAEGTKEKLLALANTWTTVEGETIDATARLVAGMAIKEADDEMAGRTPEQTAIAIMLEQASTALVLLEVDFQPGSLAEAAEIWREDRSELIAMGCQLHEQRIAMELGRYSDPAEVMTFFALMHRYPDPVAQQQN